MKQQREIRDLALQASPVNIASLREYVLAHAPNTVAEETDDLYKIQLSLVSEDQYHVFKKILS
jgi:hypothetical protein